MVPSRSDPDPQQQACSKVSLNPSKTTESTGHPYLCILVGDPLGEAEKLLELLLRYLAALGDENVCELEAERDVLVLHGQVHQVLQAACRDLPVRHILHTIQSLHPVLYIPVSRSRSNGITTEEKFFFKQILIHIFSKILH
jgi:hypothetical protein